MQYLLTKEEMDSYVSREEYNDLSEQLNRANRIRETALELVLDAHKVKCVNRSGGISYCELCPVGVPREGFDVHGICERKKKYSDEYIQSTRLGRRK